MCENSVQLQMIYNWASNLLTRKGQEQNVHVTTCSSRFDLKTSASTHNRSCCKHSPVQVYGTDPYMAMVYLHTGLQEL
jgi:hypothetical protein